MSMVLRKETMVDVSNQLKENNREIVFTHGSFDLLHIGHIEFLRRSKKMGDYLIVGIDEDDLVKSYKGDHRPIIPLNERMLVLMELRYVDFVMPIEAPKNRTNKYYMEMYDQLSPEFITCGHNFDFMKEIKKCKKELGNIKFKKIIHQYDNFRSTTGIITQIKDEE